MKSFCNLNALTATNTSESTSLLRAVIIWMRRWLKMEAARRGSTAHWPSMLLVASSAGTQPRGPVPVTRTLRAPNIYSLCRCLEDINQQFFSSLSLKYYQDRWRPFLFFSFFFSRCTGNSKKSSIHLWIL